MKKLHGAVRIALLVLAGAGAAAFVKAEPPRQKWEYECDSAYPHDVANLNELGAQGWELVGMLPGNTGAPYFCFKRPRT